MPKSGLSPRKWVKAEKESTKNTVLFQSARSAAWWIVEKLLTDKYSNHDQLFDRFLSFFSQRDKAKIRKLVLGTLRWLSRLDYIIEQISNRELDKIQPTIMTILRVSTYELLELPRTPAYAILSEAVEGAKAVGKRGAGSFVNAILRKIATKRSFEKWPIEESDLIKKLSIEYSHPEFLIKRWLKLFGYEQTLSILKSNNEEHPVTILTFKSKGGREYAAEHLIEAGIDVEPSFVSPLALIVKSKLPASLGKIIADNYYVQDSGGQMAALTPLPFEGENILDAAASPGGKTFSLLAFNNNLNIVANDASVKRVALLAQNASRLGFNLDLCASRYAEGIEEKFDRVIADLPCSGTGTLKKNPEIKWRISEETINKFKSENYKFIEKLKDKVKVGGLLVIITCSIEPEENLEIAQQFLEKYRNFTFYIPRVAFPNVRFYRISSSLVILPTKENDGYSITILRKVADE